MDRKLQELCSRQGKSRNQNMHPSSREIVTDQERVGTDVWRSAAKPYYADGCRALVLLCLVTVSALIFLSAVVAYLPVPDLFNQALGVMARFLPPDSMGLVRRVLADMITPNRGTFLSFGILGSLWAASGGFSAAIEALNLAYKVNDDRPFWKTRPLALGLALLAGALLLVALSVMIVGPRFGEWLASRVHLSNLFILLWPYIHWSIAIGFAILAV